MAKAAVPAHAQRMSSLLAADKEFASCRKWGVYIIGGEVRAGRRGGEGIRGGSVGMHGVRLSKGCVGAKGTRGERTWNMRVMSVTLEVSKLSGWLKADARCRVEGRAHAMRGEVRAGRREGLWCGGGTQAACTGMARLKA